MRDLPGAMPGYILNGAEPARPCLLQAGLPEPQTLKPGPDTLNPEP